ncbi:MAG: hypothetical protein V3R60_03725 [Acidobacteriota bacterium]
MSQWYTKCSWDSTNAKEVDWVDIYQGYLPGDRIIERIRQTQGLNGVKFLRTIKLGFGVSRIEIEDSVNAELFEALWPLTAGKRVHKRRYRVPDGELTWEIDEFLDQPLYLAEVELDAERSPAIPEWLRSHIEREVTDEAAFANVNLAR